VLSCVELEKRFGDVVALDGATFEVQPGRILGFLGPNGAGKTTAMRCIFGLVRPDAGEVLWNGESVTPEQCLRFGYMPEERGLYPKMTIREQLVYFARLSGLGRTEANESADRWLETFGLTDRASSKLEQLSHGNQQRVQLAVALVHDPVLAVLDEPFSGLDPIGMEALSETLHALAAEGVGIIFSSHQLDLVEDVCEDAVIIHEGRVVVTGSLADLRARSEHRRLVIEVDGQPWAPEIPGVERIEIRKGKVRYLARQDTGIDEILAMAQREGEVTRFAFEPPSLSDLFREAVGR